MLVRSTLRRLSLSASVAALSTGFVMLAAAPACAQATPAATETAVDNLLKGLVEQGVLNKKKAEALATKFHADLRQPAAATSAQQNTAAPSTTPEASANMVRVPYVPQIMKDEIKNQVKAEVVAQAKDEHWATPGTFPEWVSRISIFGDIRGRDEARNFGKGNDPTFVDTAAMNAGNAYDVNQASSKYTGLPILNSTVDRNLVRVRARLGVKAQIDDDLVAVIRVATGSDTSPVSTNQTLGSYYGKKNLWLDQAYISYTPTFSNSQAAFTLGRMPNPFEKTEMVWDDDINPEGVAASIKHSFAGSGLSLGAVVGAFPLDTVADNFPTNRTSDEKVGMGGNKWLFAGQARVAYDMSPVKLSLSGAYYDFANSKGKLSPSCTNVDAMMFGCPTDASRPAFMQKGNSLFLLRNITDPGFTGADPQYFGLASKFQIVDLVAKADYAASDSVHVMLTGDYARNLAYSKNAITALPIANNNETCSVVVPAGKTCSSAGGTGVFKSGKNAWFARLAVGSPEIAKRWDWNMSFAYEYVEPDALVDAFTDSDFHLGGTNAKGWTLGGNLGLAKNTWVSAKWLSADAVYGPPLAIDVLQVDLNVRF